MALVEEILENDGAILMAASTFGIGASYVSLVIIVYSLAFESFYIVGRIRKETQ